MILPFPPICMEYIRTLFEEKKVKESPPSTIQQAVPTFFESPHHHQINGGHRAGDRLTGWCVFICYSLGGWVLVYLTIYGWVGLRWYFFHRVTHYFSSNVMSHLKPLKNKYSNLLNIFYFCIILPLLLMHSSEIRGLWLKKLTQWSVSKFAIFLKCIFLFSFRATSFSFS